MKILHLTDLFHPNIGGLESHVLNLVRERQRRGHEISVVTVSYTHLTLSTNREV